MQENVESNSLDWVEGQASPRNEAIVNIEMKIEESRLKFRTFVFRFALILIAFLYAIFVHLLFHLGTLLPLMKGVPYSVLLILFSGSIPTVLLSILIFAIFRARNKKTDKNNEQDLLDTVSKVASVARLFK
ncbi:hypothetical protein [Maridesulfovibrio hydrothermalis]|uniref:Uncharacterized protein n=1 Tax=Maridesulfovibrio hydrothermalis AM13 = DSM 14728 TaxID=1121451 RepID=L0RAR7_9BACT|nr:hypothetical protein [Maridesulfovibrio hydrothermalis]CCO22666.1 protein of unknown function [Maridesulfovibrio hydrothermalis AM13 = DSM 14728]